MPHPTPARRGFTLIELAIVLVVLGLLVGGLLVGQSLIAAAKLRSVIGDVRAFDTAINTFQDRYDSLPGDMTNATRYWGSDPAGCDTFAGSEQPATATCDGNGDGQINPAVNVGNPAPSDYPQWGEQYRAWQQLADAGLIPGAFIGKPALAWGYSQNGTWSGRFPAAKYPQAKYSVTYLPADVASANIWAFFAGNYGHTYFLGGAIGPMTSTPVFTSADAQTLDAKMDDGRPGTGVVRTLSYGAGSATWCPTTADPATAAYTNARTAKCLLLVTAGF